MNVDDTLSSILKSEAPRIEPNPKAWQRISTARPRRHRAAMYTAVAAAAVTAVTLSGVALNAVRTGRASRNTLPTIATSAPATSGTATSGTDAARDLTVAPTTAGTAVASDDVPTGRLGAAFAGVVKDGDGYRLALLAKADGSLIRQLSKKTYNWWLHPTASADGKYVYFFDRVDAACNGSIYRVPTAGGPAVAFITGQPFSGLFWLSADGSRITAQVTACNIGPHAKRKAVQYDAATGQRIRELQLDGPAGTEVGAVVSDTESKRAVLERLDLKMHSVRLEMVDLADDGVASRPRVVTGLSACEENGIGHIEIAANYVYFPATCLPRGKSRTAGHIYRADFSAANPVAEVIATVPGGGATYGLYVDAAGSDIVYSTSKTGQDVPTTGTTVIYRVGPGGKSIKLVSDGGLSRDLAW